MSTSNKLPPLPDEETMKEMLNDLKDIDPEKLKEMLKFLENMSEDDKEAFRQTMAGMNQFTTNNPFTPSPNAGSGRSLLYLLAWLLPIILIIIYLAFKLYNNIKRRQTRHIEKRKKESQNKKENIGKKKN